MQNRCPSCSSSSANYPAKAANIGDNTQQLKPEHCDPPRPAAQKAAFFVRYCFSAQSFVHRVLATMHQRINPFALRRHKMFKMNEFQMFAMANPEATLRMVRVLVFAILLLVSLALPGVAFAQPMGGDVGT